MKKDISTVGDTLLHYLNLEGVDHVFGIPGGGLAHLLTSFKNNKKDFTYIVCRQETGAAYIADGYFRATGKLGVVMVTSGPGATNAVTGVMNADNDGSAMLLITGEVDQHFYGKGYLQEGIDSRLDVEGIYKSSTRYSAILSASFSAETLIQQAMRDARSIPCRAVHLSVPNNVTVETIECPILPKSTTEYRTSPSGIDAEELKKVMISLTSAKRPLIFLGNGCRRALEDKNTFNALKNFAETYAIPVMTTADGKGVFPESHPLSLRVYGIADCMWPYYWLTQQDPAYDAIVVVGSSLGELSTNKWLPMLVPNGPFIQVDMNQSIIGRAFTVTQGIVGEAGAFFREIEKHIPEYPADRSEKEARISFLKNLKETESPFEDQKSYDSSTSPIAPPSMMRILNEKLPKDTLIFLDAGNCVGWGVHYYVANSPGAIHSSLSMGPMGFAVGAVVGAKIGKPDTCCVCLCGDGAFMMQGAEVSTAKQYGVGAIWIVLNDNELNMVVQGQENFFPDEKDPDVWKELYQLGDPDLVSFAKGLGAEAVEISSTKALSERLDLILNDPSKNSIPQVIVVKIDSQEVPPYYNPKYAH